MSNLIPSFTWTWNKKPRIKTRVSGKKKTLWHLGRSEIIRINGKGKLPYEGTRKRYDYTSWRDCPCWNSLLSVKFFRIFYYPSYSIKSAFCQFNCHTIFLGYVKWQFNPEILSSLVPKFWIVFIVSEKHY